MKKNKYEESVHFRVDADDLAHLLRTLRVSKDMSMRELSTISGVTAAHICNIENRKITTTFITVSKLFNALGHTVADAYTLMPSR